MHLCAVHHQEDVHRKIRGSLRQSGIFAHGAKLAVAVNGSAESAVLIYVLKSLFSNRKDIELMAIMIDEGIDGYRLHALDIAVKLANELDVPYVIKRFKEVFGTKIDELHNIKEPCSICESMRNELLTRSAVEYGANAVAIGSNLDAEAAEIMFGYLREDINGMLHNQNLSGILNNAGEKIAIIKPLRRIPAEEVRLYANSLGIPFISSPCPYTHGQLRDVRKELRGFEERHPGTNYSLLRSIERMAELHLSRDVEGQSL